MHVAEGKQQRVRAQVLPLFAVGGWGGVGIGPITGACWWNYLLVFLLLLLFLPFFLLSWVTCMLVVPLSLSTHQSRASRPCGCLFGCCIRQCRPPLCVGRMAANVCLWHVAILIHV